MDEWSVSPGWFVLGLVGQATFFSRFVVQWAASERAGHSYIPLAFWWLSLAGSMLLLGYAIHRKDPVFVLGQAFGWLVYARNLVLIRRGTLAASA
ncbi:MAG: lipid-A-disaccharide synthase N-terminal domain-containing protein [Myxococcota bacterium]